MQDVNDRSICERQEYGGYVYVNDDGTYSYSEPVTVNEKATVTIHVPRTLNLVGLYHTHGGYDPSFWGEHFSDVDLDVADTGRNGISFLSYLGTPSGAVVRYKGDKKNPRHGSRLVLVFSVSPREKKCDCESILGKH